MKKKTVFTICFVIIVGLGIAAGFWLLSKRDKEPSQPKQGSYELMDESFQKSAVSTGVKLYATDIDGLFYSISPVKYFLAQNGEIQEIKPMKAIHLSPVVAGTKMEFDIAPVRVGSRYFGVGLWHKDSGVYNDVFAVLEDMPKAFASPYTYLLMLDTVQSDKDAQSRRYSELFGVEKGGGIGGYLFAQNNRMSEPSGKLRTDWDCTTLTLVRQGYTLTGRKYNHSDTAQQYDLRQTRAGNTDTCVRGISDTFLFANKKEVYYTKESKTAWAVYRGTGKAAKRTAQLQGTVAEYTLSGLSAIKKADNSVVYLLNGTTTAAAQTFKKVYAVGSIGTKQILLGKEQNKEGLDYKVQKIQIADSKTGQTQVYYANNIADENSPLSVCQEGILLQKEGKSVYISYKALATLPHSVLQ